MKTDQRDKGFCTECGDDSDFDGEGLYFDIEDGFDFAGCCFN